MKRDLKRALAFVAALGILMPALAMAQEQAPAPAPAVERVALLPPSGTNVHEGYLQAAQDFLRAHLETTGSFQVALLPGDPTLREVPAYEAAGRGREIGADLSIVLHIARLGNTARVRIAVYDTQTGAIVHVDEMAAGSPDDLDKVLKRLAEGVFSGQKAADNAQVDTVTEKESEAYLKLTATNVFGVKIGAVTPISRAGEGESTVPGLGIYWMYDARSFLAEVLAECHVKGSEGLIGGDDSNHYCSLGIGAYYPFSKNNTAPYVGGSIHYGRAAYSSGEGSEGGTGVTFHVTGGALIGRLSSVQLRAEGSFFFNTFDETDGMETAKAIGFVFGAGIGF